MCLHGTNYQPGLEMGQQSVDQKKIKEDFCQKTTQGLMVYPDNKWPWGHNNQIKRGIREESEGLTQSPPSDFKILIPFKNQPLKTWQTISYQVISLLKVSPSHLTYSLIFLHFYLIQTISSDFRSLELYPNQEKIFTLIQVESKSALFHYPPLILLS